MIQIDLIENAKTTAETYMREAFVWVSLNPADWDKFKSLQKTIAIDLLEHSDLTDSQKRVILNAWPIFRGDEMTEKMRALYQKAAEDSNVMASFRKFVDTAMGCSDDQD